MSRSSSWFAILVMALLAAGCGETEPPPSLDAGTLPGLDAGQIDGDAGAETDAGIGADAGEDDAGLPADAGVTVPLPGFGALSGLCGVLDDELLSPEPFLFENHLDFGTDPYDDADEPLLTEGGREMIADGNAGGSSLVSEVFAFEALARCELATLLATEMEVTYLDPTSKITDLVVEIDGLKVGVSVVRAMSWPREGPYPLEEATRVLTKKLEGIIDSSLHVAPEDKWVKQILHVLAWGPDHAATFEQAWEQISPDLKADTIVIVTITDGADSPLYDN